MRHFQPFNHWVINQWSTVEIFQDELKWEVSGEVMMRPLVAKVEAYNGWNLMISKHLGIDESPDRCFFTCLWDHYFNWMLSVTCLCFQALFTSLLVFFPSLTKSKSPSFEPLLNNMLRRDTYWYQLVRVIMMYREAKQRWKWKKE